MILIEIILHFILFIVMYVATLSYAASKIKYLYYLRPKHWQERFLDNDRPNHVAKYIKIGFITCGAISISQVYVFSSIFKHIIG